MAESKLEEAENDAVLIVVVATFILAFIALAPGLLISWTINLFLGGALVRDLVPSQIVSLAAVISFVIYVVLAGTAESGWDATFRFFGLGALSCFIFLFSYYGLHSHNISRFLGHIHWFGIIDFLGDHLGPEFFILVAVFFVGAGFWVVGLFLLFTGIHSDVAQVWMWAAAIQILIFFAIALVQGAGSAWEDNWSISTISLVIGTPLLCLVHWGLLLHWPVTLCHFFVPDSVWVSH